MARTSFQGGVAIITGGASGIGRALGEELAKQGCYVVLADRQIDLAQQVADEIVKNGGSASAALLDVTKREDVFALIDEVLGEKGKLDYMFNNAGINMAAETKDYTLDHWIKMIDVNLMGVIWGTHAAYRVMRKQGFGHIVNTASVGGLVPETILVNYAAAKHGVVGLSTSLRPEAERFGVKVSVLCPGPVNTPISRGGKYGSAPDGVTPEMMEKLFNTLMPMDPNEFARKALRKIAANLPIIVLPSSMKIRWWIHRLHPRLGIAISKFIFLYSLRALKKARNAS